MPRKYGFGNTRKKSPYPMGKAHYGKDQKNPMPMHEKSPVMKKDGYEGPIGGMPIGGMKTAAVKKYKSHSQRKAVHASKAEKK